MTDARMDPAFRDALRGELVRTVSGHRRPWFRRSWLVAGPLALAAVAGGGVAVATDLITLPGTDRVRALAAAVETVRTGTASIELGPRPVGSTHVEVWLTCLTPGSFTFADGAGGTCDGAGGKTGYSLALAPGQTRTTITASPDTRWSITTTYVRRQPTDWETNAAGETYGVVKGQEEPDLIAVYATNGRLGYARADNLKAGPPTAPADATHTQAERQASRTVPVYELDGRTVIGEFRIG
jgi:hypothetical protein